ncbi:MAG: hypothetical protein ACK4NF_00925 [Planctomycetota bacterium]
MKIKEYIKRGREMGFYIFLVFVGIILWLHKLGYNVWKHWPVVLIAIGILGIIDKLRRKGVKLIFSEESDEPSFRAGNKKVGEEKKNEGKSLHIEVIDKSGKSTTKVSIPLNMINWAMKFASPFIKIAGTTVNVSDLEKLFESGGEIITVNEQGETVKIYIE